MQIPTPPSTYGRPDLRTIPETKSRAFTVHSYHEPTHRFLWHYHPEWEITYTRAGCGTRHVGTSVEQFGPDDLTLLPGNVPHTWFSSADQVGDARCSVIQFLPSMWGEAFWKLPEMKDFNSICERAQRGVRFTGPAVQEVGRRIEAMAETNGPTLAAMGDFFHILQLLSQLEVHSLHAIGEGTSSWQNGRLEGVLAWIEKHLTEQITQSDVAATMNMSPASFSRWFKKNTGCGFQRYLTEMRVAKACGLLAGGELSITAAAFQAGYNNLSNFNRRFFDVTGLSPSAYRAQIRGGIRTRGTPAGLHGDPLPKKQSG